MTGPAERPVIGPSFDPDGPGYELAAPSSFTCPRCGMTSYNPNDIREGYCGACHDWMAPR